MSIETGSCQWCGKPGWLCLFCSILGERVIACKMHNQSHFKNDHEGTRHLGEGLVSFGSQKIVPQVK